MSGKRPVAKDTTRLLSGIPSKFGEIEMMSYDGFGDMANKFCNSETQEIIDYY